jgi:hypothetical protein
MRTDVKHLWDALSIFGDHFARLGGARRYRNMTESDIALYVGCQLATAISPTFDRSQFIDSMFLDSAKPVLIEVDGKIAEVEQTPEKLAILIVELVTYAERRLNGSDRADSWCRFVEWAGALTPSNSFQPRRH